LKRPEARGRYDCALHPPTAATSRSRRLPHRSPKAGAPQYGRPDTSLKRRRSGSRHARASTSQRTRTSSAATIRPISSGLPRYD